MLALLIPFAVDPPTRERAGAGAATTHGRDRSDQRWRPRCQCCAQGKDASRLSAANFKITMEIYTQVTDQQTRDALKRLGESLG